MFKSLRVLRLQMLLNIHFLKLTESEIGVFYRPQKYLPLTRE